MPSMPLLIHKLKTTYPDISFIEAEQFSWSPSARTVFYTPGAPNAPHLLLHELSHALLDHHTYRHDVELVVMETAAWEKAKECAKTHNIRLNETVIQDHLDTYRDWLHARSTCPECSANGYQIEAFHYECPACLHKWKVNEARLCALRRYEVTGA